MFAGIVLSLLTLCSCSRKKASQAADGDLITIPKPEEINLPIFSTDSEMPEEEALDEEYIAEEERYGTDVLNYLEDEANFTSPIIQTEEEISPTAEDNQAPEVETVEKRLTDAYNRLKAMEYGSEIFLPVNNQDSSVIVHYSDKKAVRLFYDNLYRLTKKEYWNMPSVDNAAITGTEKYLYEGDSKKPYEKTIEKDSSIFVSKLNQNGLVIKTEKFELLQDGSVSKKAQSLTSWTYDEKDRITSETVSEDKLVKKQVFNYAKSDGLVQTSRVQSKKEESDKDQGDQSKDQLPPDYEYYENGFLLTKTEYIDKGVYSTTIWFDSSNWVRTDYENYVKVRDVYYTDGVERRVKKYE